MQRIKFGYFDIMPCIKKKNKYIHAICSKSGKMTIKRLFWPLVFRSTVFVCTRTGPVPGPKAFALQRPSYIWRFGPLGPPDRRGQTIFYVHLYFANKNKIHLIRTWNGHLDRFRLAADVFGGRGRFDFSELRDDFPGKPSRPLRA